MTINFLNIAQVLVAVALIGFILIQRGPGATAGSAFGGGASGTVFGAKGSGSFLTKATAILATLFFIITMLIAIDARNSYSATGEVAEQDLGVFGSLDVDTGEPTVGPVADEKSDNTPVNEALNAVDQAIETGQNAEDNTVEGSEESTTPEEMSEETAAETSTESDDSDGGNN